jgi:hypothetical protein
MAAHARLDAAARKVRSLGVALSILPLPFVLGSCGDEVLSCGLLNESVAMHATVADNKTGVHVEIQLSTGDEDGPGTALTLCDGESIAVNGEPAVLSRVLGELYYTVEFAEPTPSYEIEFTRELQDDVVARIDMPEAFTIDAPAEDSPHSRAEPLEVLWSPAREGEVIELAVEDEIGSSCIEGLGLELEVPDSGSYTVAGGSLVGGEMAEACQVWIALTRAATGEYPGELHPSGRITGYVKRRHGFRSEP